MKMYFHLYPDVLLLAVAIDKTERFLAHLLPYRRSVLIRLPQQLLINTFSIPPRFGKRSSLRVEELNTAAILSILHTQQNFL